MSNPPEKSEERSRIILPGSETPDTSGSGIVLPPGVSREEPEDLPEFPKLRPLMLMPFNDGKREMLLVTDPLGVVEGQPVLGMESVALLQLMDGTVSLNDINSALVRESKDIRVANMVRDFVGRLDKLLMLDSPRFQEAYREIRENYHRLEVRPAVLEGHSYPAEQQELDTFLSEHLDEAKRWRTEAEEPEATANAVPRALMAPHLDPHRAGAAIARAYMEIGDRAKSPLRVVVFGVGHSMIGDLLALTRQHFETPLGKVECDTAFVDAVAEQLGDAAYASELTHRDEHSIEFQALYLKQRFGDRPIKLVPILIGGFHMMLDQGLKPRDNTVFEAMIAAIGEAEQSLGGETVYVAAVDFSHVGPRFGDPPLDDAAKKDVETKDRKAIDAALRGDAEGWFDAIAGHQDSTRICGFGATYAMLRCAAVTDGRLLRYQQSSEEDGSMVSVASMVWS